MTAFFSAGMPSAGVYFTSPVCSRDEQLTMASMGALLLGSPPPRWITGSPFSLSKAAVSLSFKVGDSEIHFASWLKLIALVLRIDWSRRLVRGSLPVYGLAIRFGEAPLGTGAEPAVFSKAGVPVRVWILARRRPTRKTRSSTVRFGAAAGPLAHARGSKRNHAASGSGPWQRDSISRSRRQKESRSNERLELAERGGFEPDQLQSRP